MAGSWLCGNPDRRGVQARSESQIAARPPARITRCNTGQGRADTRNVYNLTSSDVLEFLSVTDFRPVDAVLLSGTGLASLPVSRRTHHPR